MYGPLLEQPHLSQSSYIDILIEEAEKLYNRIVKEMVYEINVEHVDNLSKSLPMLPSDYKHPTL
jgi:hypothetical protein